MPKPGPLPDDVHRRDVAPRDDEPEVHDLDPAFDLTLFAAEGAPAAPQDPAAGALPGHAVAPAQPGTSGDAPPTLPPARAPLLQAPEDHPAARTAIEASSVRPSVDTPSTGSAQAPVVRGLRALIAQRKSAVRAAEAARPEEEVQRGSAARTQRHGAPLGAALVLAIGALGGLAAWGGWLGAWNTPRGQVRIESTPPGAQVMVDDEARGTTPLALALPPGTHRVRLEHAGASHSIDVRVQAGRDTAHHVHLGSAGPAATASGSTPAAAARTGDTRSARERGAGTPDRGIATTGRSTRATQPAAPATQATAPRQAARRPVTAPAPPPPPVMPDGALAGWVTVDAPVELQMVLEGRIVGTSRADRTMLPAGTYAVEFSSDRVGFRASQPITVVPGQHSSVRVEVPPGALSVNALPWAEVVIDGKPAGETPLGEVPVAAGVHEVVFRHPELGEQRHEALVRVGQHTRISVDLRRR